jgi:hypothetical protein
MQAANFASGAHGITCSHFLAMERWLLGKRKHEHYIHLARCVFDDLSLDLTGTTMLPA